MKRQQFDVIMKPTEDGAEPTVHRVSIVLADRLAGEITGSQLGLNHEQLKVHQSVLNWHAAMVRLGHYKGDFNQFKVDCIDVDAAPDALADPDLGPTPEAASDGSASN